MRCCCRLPARVSIFSGITRTAANCSRTGSKKKHSRWCGTRADTTTGRRRRRRATLRRAAAGGLRGAVTRPPARECACRDGNGREIGVPPLYGRPRAVDHRRRAGGDLGVGGLLLDGQDGLRRPYGPYDGAFPASAVVAAGRQPADHGRRAEDQLPHLQSSGPAGLFSFGGADRRRLFHRSDRPTAQPAGFRSAPSSSSPPRR